MGLSIQKKKFSDFSSEESLRFDYQYISSFEIEREDFLTYKELFDFVPYKNLNLSKLGNFKYAEIGNVTKTGEVNPVELSFEDRQEEHESLFKKIEKGDIIQPLNCDILISKIRPYLNKNILISNDSIFFTKAFIHIRPKINSKLFYLALRKKFIHQLVAVSRQGKGYPTLREEDIKTIRFPAKLISTLVENEELILNDIYRIESEIEELTATKTNTFDIINHIFSENFKINLEDLKKIDQTAILSVPLRDIKKYNSGLRTSFRWNKLQYIQDIIYADIDCIDTLGKYIKSTKNGWSPVSIEGEDGIPVLGQEHFNTDGILKIKPSKATEQVRTNIDDFFIKKGDFFVSRGNTVDLVALASIVEEEIEDNIIYPDLYIKIELDESKIDKKYLAFLFNSFIGRIYFKYVAKGKNQTMVKVSSSELLNFRLPIPNKEIQLEIVESIENLLKQQILIDKNIDEKQSEIYEIIDSHMK